MNRSQKRQHLTPDMIRSKIISAVEIANKMKFYPNSDYYIRLCKRTNNIAELNLIYETLKLDTRSAILCSKPSLLQIILIKIKRLFR